MVYGGVNDTEPVIKDDYKKSNLKVSQVKQFSQGVHVYLFAFTLSPNPLFLF